MITEVILTSIVSSGSRTEDPYANIDKKYKIGEIYSGTVTKIMDYGCFVRIEEGIEGLIHNSQLDWTTKPQTTGSLT